MGTRARRMAGLLVALGCAWVLAAPSQGQSLLTLGVPPGPGAGLPSAASLDAMTLPQLQAQVGVASGQVLYPLLKARILEQMAGASPSQPAGTPSAGTPSAGTPPGAGTPRAQPASNDWERGAWIALLRAGEGVAPPAELEQWARRFIQRFPDDENFPLAFFFLSQALSLQGKPLEQSFFFDQSAFASLPPAYQTRLLLLRAAQAEREENWDAAAEWRLQEMADAGGQRQTRPSDVLADLQSLTDPALLEALLKRWPQLPWLQEQAPVLRVQALVNAGQGTEALLAADQLLQGPAGANPALRDALQQAKAQVLARTQVHPERIGVLLPLTSGNRILRDLARQALDGLRLGVPYDQGGTPAATPGAPGLKDAPPERDAAIPVAAGKLSLELVVADTGNDPARAAQMVERLVKQDQVIAIIGPLAKAESDAAAAQAERLGVPLLSLSLTLDLPPNAQFTFRDSMSEEDEVRSLVDYATDYLRARRFAILYPDNTYGQRMMRLFWQDALARGDRITAAAAFTPWSAQLEGQAEPVGLKQIFSEFTGQDRPLSPQEQALLDAVGDRQPDPIVDFDALYIPLGPDAAQDLRLIAPYPVTVDAQDALLLGSRFWNNDAVLAVAGAKLEGAAFVDVYDRSGSSPRLAEFMSRHRQWFGHRARYQPPTYYTAAAYDSLAMLRELLQDPRHRTRPALSRALKGPTPFAGVTSQTAFRPDGEAIKEALFFRIRGLEFVREIP